MTVIFYNLTFRFDVRLANLQPGKIETARIVPLDIYWTTMTLIGNGWLHDIIFIILSAPVTAFIVTSVLNSEFLSLLDVLL